MFSMHIFNGCYMTCTRFRSKNKNKKPLNMHKYKRKKCHTYQNKHIIINFVLLLSLYIKHEKRFIDVPEIFCSTTNRRWSKLFDICDLYLDPKLS